MHEVDSWRTDSRALRAECYILSIPHNATIYNVVLVSVLDLSRLSHGNSVLG